MKVALLVLAALVGTAAAVLSLGGSVQEQQRQFYQCQLGALKQFPDDKPTDAFSRTVTYLEACMGAAGYVVDSKKRFCEPSDFYRMSQSFCYMPIGRLARWRQDMEIWLTR